MSGDNPSGEHVGLARLDERIARATEIRNREANEVGMQDQSRKRLLARMAGNIAGGVEANPATLGLSAEEVAIRAVEIARVILERLEL